MCKVQPQQGQDGAYAQSQQQQAPRAWGSAMNTDGPGQRLHDTAPRERQYIFYINYTQKHYKTYVLRALYIRCKKCFVKF